MRAWLAVLLASRSLAQILVFRHDTYYRNSIDVSAFEVRLFMTGCREPRAGEDVTQISSCFWKRRTEPGNILYGRNPGAGFVYTGSVSWPPSLQFEQNQPSGGFIRFFYDETSGMNACETLGAGPYCRYRTICSMREEYWGKVLRSEDNQNDPLSKYRGNNFPMENLHETNVAGDWAPRTTEQCMACPVQQCKSPYCGNGAVVPQALSLVNNAVIVPPDCGKSCSAGTFLTCKNQPSCEYQPLTGAWNPLQWLQHNVQTVRSDAQLIVPSVAPGVPSLVGDCYPCRFAEGRMHFGTTWSTDPVLYAKGFLGFYCPGASAGPARCSDADPNMVARIGADGRSGACGCRPGMHYDGGAGRCVPCPPGFFCQWQGDTPPVARECPNGNYSTGGAEACLDCDMSQRCDPGFALTRCVQSGGTGAHQKRNAYCTSCINCKELSGASGTATCYRVAALV